MCKIQIVIKHLLCEISTDYDWIHLYEKESYGSNSQYHIFSTLPSTKRYASNYQFLMVQIYCDVTNTLISQNTTSTKAITEVQGFSSKII